MTGIYDPALLLLAVLLAILAAYTLLDLAGTLRTAHGWPLRIGLAAGAIAIGTASWSMHLIGLLSIRRPGIAMAYRGAPLAVALGLAIAAAALALATASRPRPRVRRIVAAGAAFGVAAALLHYILHLGARTFAVLSWGRVAAAVAAAAALGIAFLGLAATLRRPAGGPGRATVNLRRVLGAAVMGVIAAGLHYVPAASVALTAVPRTAVARPEDVLATTALAVAVAATTALVLALVLVASAASRARTEARTAASRLGLLADISSALARTLDYPTTLRHVARLAVPGLADWCIVELADERGKLRRAAMAADDPRTEQLLQRIANERLPDPLHADGLKEVYDTGRSRLVPEFPAEILARIALDREHLGELRRLSPKSVIVVPLIARDRRIGVLGFARSRPGRPYGPEDLALAEEVGRRAAVAIDNARLYQEAVVANRAKSDFLAVMSHELRTPLNAIVGFADLIDAEVSGPTTPQQRRQLARIRANAEQLRSLIDQILTFTAAETGDIAVKLVPIDLDAFAHEVAAQAKAEAEKKGLRLSTRVRTDSRAFTTDPGLLRHILTGLLSNAVKFTDEGSVTFEVEHRPDGQAVFRVRDTGPGIPPGQFDAVFEPFVQIERPTTRRVGGAGLGLSLVRRLARALGGDVVVEESSPAGTTFVARLPPAPAKRRAA